MTFLLMVINLLKTFVLYEEIKHPYSSILGQSFSSFSMESEKALVSASSVVYAFT